MSNSRYFIVYFSGIDKQKNSIKEGVISLETKGGKYINSDYISNLASDKFDVERAIVKNIIEVPMEDFFDFVEDNHISRSKEVDNLLN